MKISTLFILLTLNISKSSQEEKIYFQQKEKKLTANQIGSVVNKKELDCLSLCLYDDRCKAFNAYKGNDDVNKCDFFDKDRCSAGTSLVDSNACSYFDTHGDQPCPRRKW